MEKLLLLILLFTLSCSKNDKENDEKSNIINSTWTGSNSTIIDGDGIYKETTSVFFNPDKTNAEFTVVLSRKRENENEYKEIETNHYKFTYNNKYPNISFFCECDSGEQYGQLNGKFANDKFTISEHGCLWETPALITCLKK